MAEPQYFSAGRGVIKFNGVKIASCTNIGWNETVGRRAVRVIGELEAVERVAVSVDVSLNVGFVKTVKLSEVQLGLMGGRRTVDLIKEEPVLIEIADKGQAPQKTIYSFIDCVYTGGQWSLPAGDILTGSASFDGRRLKQKDEA